MSYYYPMYIHTSGHSRTIHEEGVQHCIEDNQDLSAKHLRNAEFTTEEVQAIQACADNYVDEQNQIAGWFVGGALLFVLALIVIAWRS